MATASGDRGRTPGGEGMPAGDASAASRRRRRARRLKWTTAILLTLLSFQFFRFQVLRSHDLTLQSERNRLRPITLTAPRGAVYDREGRVLAESVPGYRVAVLPAREESVRRSLERLSRFLPLDSARTEALLRQYRRHPNRVLTVTDDADFQVVSAIEERRPHFPRVTVEMVPRREYPAGPATAHLLGYVGEVSGEELTREAFAGYRAGRVVGKAGLERQYEGRLSGEPGTRYVEVNAVGSVVREFGPRPTDPPVPGEDVVLGLDLRLQLAADSLFPEDHKGAVVALDPRNGEVLLYYSHPSYDTNRFVGGVAAEFWEALQEDPDRPLLDRVSVATYPPGSTFKLALAGIALRRGDAGIGTRMPEVCTGGFQFGNRRFRCWKPEGHGSLDLAGAIKRSCNVYFYQLGLRIGLEALLEGSVSLGFGQPTGIDLPFEASGYLPPDTDWFTRRYGRYGWTRAVTLNLAIGQGENRQTLLGMAQFYSALATGQRPVVPHLLRNPRLSERRAEWSPGLSDSQLNDLHGALVEVVNGEGGTAYPYRLEQWRLAGKTGTAQNPGGEPHSWFVGFAPAEEPEIVIASIVEHGHPDNQTSLAVPYAAQLVDRYLDSASSRPDRIAEVREPPE